MSDKIKKVTGLNLKFNSFSKTTVSNKNNQKSESIDYYELTGDNELLSSDKIDTNSDKNIDQNNKYSIDYSDVKTNKSNNVFNFKAVNFNDSEHQSEEDIKRYNKYMSDIYITLKNSNLFTLEQIAGIMSNMREETLTFFNPGTNYERIGSNSEYYKDLFFYDAKTGEKIDLDLTSDGAAGRALKSRGIPSKGGIGILQWTGERKEKYITWCNENNYEWDDAAHQTEYFVKEYTSPEWSGFREKFEKSESAEEATKVFCTDFEQPEDKYNEAQRRTDASANLIYQAITNYENSN